MSNAFATAKQHANDMFRQSQALDDGIYGVFPDYTDRPFEWERRMRMIMASTLKHNGILSGFTQDNLLKSTLEQAEAGEVIGNRRLTLRIFGRVCRDYAKRKKADANELMIERGEVFEYGKSIGLTEAEISSVIVKTHHGNDYVKRCKIGLDWYLKMHPRETQQEEDVPPTLEDELTGVADEQAAQDNPLAITDAMIDEHELDPKQIRYAIPGHLDKTYGNGKGGLHVRHIFGAKGFDAWYDEHDKDSRLAWRLTLQYELKNPPLEALKDDDENATEKVPSNGQVSKSGTTPQNKSTSSNVPASTIENSGKQSKPTKFKKATKKNSKLRLAIGGVPGGGKTYTALQIARTMFPDGKIAVLDTESGSAEKYANDFDFDVLEINDDYRPEKYIEAIAEAEAGGYDVLIIDSLSHEWSASGGILDIVDDLKSKYKNKEGVPDSRAAWRDASPRHNSLIAAILQSKIHIIATMRCKWRSIPARDENKRPISVKVIGSLEQRDKVEYEFDIVALCDEHQNLTIDKSRCPELTGYKGNKAGKEVATRITKWLEIAA